MCGIILKINKDRSANEEVTNQFQDQIMRGSKGFGMMTIEADGKFAIHRATTEVLACVNLQLKESNAIIFHHRYPTSSTNKISQTHPILVSNKQLAFDYYLMHNGVISNTAELFDEHVNAGHEYSTYELESKKEKLETWQYNDSESLGIELALFVENKSKKVLALGGTAFILVQIEKQKQIINQIFFGRNSTRPLRMYKRNGEIMLSSEGKGDEIEPDLLYSFDPKTDKMKLSKRELIIGEEPVKTYVHKTTWDWTPAKKEEKKVEETVEDDDTPLGGYEMTAVDMIAEEIFEVVELFIHDLKAESTNPFVMDQKDCLRQISLLLKEAVETAQEEYVHVPLVSQKTNA